MNGILKRVLGIEPIPKLKAKEYNVHLWHSVLASGLIIIGLIVYSLVYTIAMTDFGALAKFYRFGSVLVLVPLWLLFGFSAMKSTKKLVKVFSPELISLYVLVFVLVASAILQYIMYLSTGSITVSFIKSFPLTEILLSLILVVGVRSGEK